MKSVSCRTDKGYLILYQVLSSVQNVDSTQLLQERQTREHTREHKLHKLQWEGTYSVT